MNWKLFSINKKESLVDILKRYSEKEVREAIPKAFPDMHLSYDPKKKPVEIPLEHALEVKKAGVTGLKGVFL